MRKLRIEEHRIYIENQKRIWAEVIDTILHDPYLSQSSGNPAYYPPVPTLSVHRDPFAHAKNQKHIIVDEAFSQYALWTSHHPITIDEWNAYSESGLSYIDTNAIYTRLQLMRTTQSMTITERYSYPNIVERVKWLVTFLSGSAGEEIIGVYC